LEQEEEIIETFVNAEESLSEATEEFFTRHHDKLEEKNKETIENFIGNGPTSVSVYMVPCYYGELLTWALQKYIARENWEIRQTLGYQRSEPIYIDVSTEFGRTINLLRDGQLLLQKGELRCIVTLNVNLTWRNILHIKGLRDNKNVLDQFIAGIQKIVDEENFYRGKKLIYDSRIFFLQPCQKSWDDVILDEAIKERIKDNTIGFLRRKKEWQEYGIPLKRGIILAGEPGTGKTAICKALLNDAPEITTITASTMLLESGEYISDLYDLAQSLAPCMVFIEDLDFIGQNRDKLGYAGGVALRTLLAVLDGLEERTEIVTIATTNYVDMLDRALSQRPSRFDRIIKLPLPTDKERQALVEKLCQKIPVDSAIQAQVARITNGCTPAQLQEIIFSLVIEHPAMSSPDTHKDTDDAIKEIITMVNGKSSHSIGFNIAGHNYNTGKSS